jgi:hypothetical protein
MRETIKKIVAGDDKLFESLIKEMIASKMLAFARPEDEEGLTLTFLNYLLEDDQDIEYIPLFTDHAEVEEFIADDAVVPDDYTLYEFDGDLLADIMDTEQYLMINPVSGGIVFQGAHLKMFASPANDDNADE